MMELEPDPRGPRAEPVGCTSHSPIQKSNARKFGSAAHGRALALTRASKALNLGVARSPSRSGRAQDADVREAGSGEGLEFRERRSVWPARAYARASRNRAWLMG